MTLLLDERSVERLLEPPAALAAVETSFRLLAGSEAVNEPRHRTRAGTTTLNVMWALVPSLDASAVKTYPVIRSDVSQATVIVLMLFSHSTGECIAVVQADLLGQRRTAAASALATRLAARPDSTALTIFGTGYQAFGQAEALTAVLPQLRDIRVVGRTASRLEQFVSRLRDRLPHVTVTAAEAEDAVRSADVVVTATGAHEPLFDGSWLRAGTHVNAIGSNQAGNRELDLAAMSRADRLIVDSRAVAALECGDLLANGMDVSATVELGQVLVGRATGRRSASDITIFESHGLALQDLVCGMHVLREARRLGLGTETEALRASVNW